jgi:sulfate adenylyltransferase subunit 1
MTAFAGSPFSIEEFLFEEREKDLLRFSTAGSVDDGKSTLIGRLLYDTQSVYEDQVRSIEGKGTTAPGQLDFALLTDGLRAEREQGITIDVAYRYFSTSRRKFIIADTPGHEQYTRNMATGASTADAAIVLLDASRGVQIQSRRHAYIASLLRVRHVLVAVNKMDLIGYDEAAFQAIVKDFTAILEKIAVETGVPFEAAFIPVSALKGDNIVHSSTSMPWYKGPSLLRLLELLPSSVDTRTSPLRFPVQRVLRPDHTFRGFAGQITSGTVRPGDTVTALPSGRTAKVERVVTWDGDLQEAIAPLSVTLVLDREIDISRGDLLVHGTEETHLSRRFSASLVWMNGKALDPAHNYLLKHTSHTVPVRHVAVRYRLDMGSLERLAAESLLLNEIGYAEIETRRPIALDRYADFRGTGAFVLIDGDTNATVAAGMVREIHKDEPHSIRKGPLTAAQRSERWGHAGEVVELNAPAAIGEAVEHALFDMGAVTVRALQRAPSMHAAMASSGILVLVHHESEDTAHLKIGDTQVEIGTDDINTAVVSILKHLRDNKILQ